MRVIGLFKELGLNLSQALPSINSAVNVLPPDVASAVASYLRSGVSVFDVMEATVDPLDNSKRIEGGASLCSDGEWIWRSDLIYFVERYRVSLPKEFISYVFAKGVFSGDSSVIIDGWKDILDEYELAEGAGK